MFGLYYGPTSDKPYRTHAVMADKPPLRGLYARLRASLRGKNAASRMACRFGCIVDPITHGLGRDSFTELPVVLAERVWTCVDTGKSQVVLGSLRLRHCC